MWIILFFIYTTTLIGPYVSSHCIDIHSHIVSQGLHYIPGANPCVLCICDKGTPKWCKSVLCSPPQNCKSFQIGSSCCEFKCLDDILTVHDGYKDTYDVALRFVASAVTAVLSLTLLFFLFHRLRRRKVIVHQNRQLSDDQRSLNSIGYIAGSFGYLPDTIGYLGSGHSELEFQYEESTAHYSLWKPHGNYFPRGEAPPPYEEAVRNSHAESNLVNTQQVVCTNANNITTNVLQRQIQSTSQLSARQQEETTQSFTTPQYANIQPSQTSAVPSSVTKLDQQILIQHKQRKISNPHETIVNTKHSNIERSDKTHDKLSNDTSNSNTIKYNKPTTSTFKLSNSKPDTSNNYENCNPMKSSSKLLRYDTMCLENYQFNFDHAHRTSKVPTNLNENCESESSFEEAIPTTDPRNKTIINLSDYQSHNLPLLPKDHSKIKPSRELRNLLFGERLDNSVRIISKSSENKGLHLHRTLPKNLRELIVRELPNEVHKSDSENSLSQSQGVYDSMLNASKSHSNIMETIRFAMEISKNNPQSNDIKTTYTVHKMGKQMDTLSSLCEYKQKRNTKLESNASKENKKEAKVEKECRVQLRESSLAKQTPHENPQIDLHNREDMVPKESKPERENRETWSDYSRKSGKNKKVNKKQPLEKDVVKNDSESSTSNYKNKSIEEKIGISYQCLSSSQDEDDYRSECENCKFSGIIASVEDSDILNETMTLQRRPLEPDEEVYYRTSLTLPTQIRKPRSILNCTNREVWFNSMQETSSSEESD